MCAAPTSRVLARQNPDNCALIPLNSVAIVPWRLHMLMDVVLSVLHSTRWSFHPRERANFRKPSNPALNSLQLELRSGAHSPSLNFYHEEALVTGVPPPRRSTSVRGEDWNPRMCPACAVHVLMRRESDPLEETVFLLGPIQVIPPACHLQQASEQTRTCPPRPARAPLPCTSPPIAPFQAQHQQSFAWRRTPPPRAAGLLGPPRPPRAETKKV